MFRMRHRAGAALGIALLSLLPGCGRRETALAPQSAAPAISLSAHRVPAAEADAAGYRVRIRLESGSASRYLYAVEPRSDEPDAAAWISIMQPEFTVAAPRRRALPGTDAALPPATHVLVRAVDARGRTSEPARLTFLADNIAPAVQIVSPVPSDRQRTYLPPTAEIRWEGVDPDGQPRAIPEMFKWTLIGPGSEFPFSVALTNPDSVRRRYAPGGYAGWDSVGAKPKGSGAVTLSGLVPGENYMFVVVARDGDGAWNQVFSQNVDMLNFRCLFPEAAGPLLRIYNESFDYPYPAPGYSTDPSREIPITVSSGRRFEIHWFATPQPGAEIAGYRWALDLESVAVTAQHDLQAVRRSGWSPLRRDLTSVELGPFGPGETHRLYVEARDNHGFRSLGIVRISTIATERQRPLLIVDDTRLFLDNRVPSMPCMNPPTGRWPTAAELDSFLYARGGFPWRCYPAGTISSPGIFAGYDFDTIGTRGPDNTPVPLSTLARYQRVLWLTDPSGGIANAPPTNLASGISALRYMTSIGRQNSLAEYARAGGQLWMAGGGVVYASMINFNRSNNDLGGITFSSASGELVPGRLPYDLAGWRSEARVAFGPVSITRFLGRLESSHAAYDGLPPAMRPKSTPTDPFPPGRTFTPADFYLTNFSLEYLSLPNAIRNGDPDTRPGPGGSPLDTLYRAEGNALVPPGASPPYNVVMTRFHGAFAGSPVILTGFNLWSFRRSDCKELVDFVLQRLWGMPPAAAAGPRVVRAEP